VVGVGGTTISLADSSGTYGGETAWSGSGGGQSVYESEPTYQSNFGILTKSRGVPDVAYDADPNTGFAVYDSVRYQGQAGWFQVGGTSAGAPQWAGILAIVDSIRAASGKSAISYPQFALYEASAYSTNFHDITSGSNGTCGTLCEASAGYDFVTGLGSPQAPALVNTLANY
jgi:subtilase family serine protease